MSFKTEAGAIIGGVVFVALTIAGLSNPELVGLTEKDVGPYALVSLIAAAGIGGGVGGYIASRS